MAIGGTEVFDAEKFWPFLFGLDDGKVYLSVGRAQLDRPPRGLDTVSKD